jgi:hypothetical protein
MRKVGREIVQPWIILLISNRAETLEIDLGIYVLKQI